ncbi:acyl-CoA mutase large subunit family protein [Hyalangium rubrum]|uniref:Methylmalonyl-CoA mutase family protein n=1 Tax=Hyalangium rubrum TaxID=3103134 RepID=A0ABU5H086_9BACT|nr:methylmalonyl-CoA mutase family protein [Hyalangium sp. s54d21]MDY7226863.1 methylmalonyl-CoA mutase family protein [Hyalangium sp. s54d21]
MADLKDEKARWQKQVYEKAKAKGGERHPSFDTSSGIEVKPVYTPEEAQGEYTEQLGFPGEYPFTRGVQPTMYRGRFWTMRQYAGFGTAEDANQRYHYLLKSGQTGLSVAFDLPTQMGRDADHARARGEVGKVGVSISSLKDMEVLLQGLPLGEVSTSMTINATAPILLCLYAAVGEKNGVALEQLSGTVQNDILKEYMARGTYIYPPEPSLRLITNMFAFCAKRIPKWNPISISGYHIREAGSTAAQEIGFTLADGIAYVDAALKAGLAVDEFAGRLSFFFNVHNNFLEEVAKFRAARRLWARIMKERFKAKDPRSMMLRFHAQTAGSTLTAQQVDNNVVRVALQAFAAVMGGAQSLHTNSRDEALALPSEEAARLALRTQQVIAYESGVADVIDPMGGSYAVEALTDELEAKAEDYLRRIDDMGGMVAAIAKGYPQGEIQEAAYQAQRDMEEKRTVVVGVNQFQVKEPPPSGLLRVDENVERVQAERMKKLRAERDNAAATRAVDTLRKAAGTADENLLPLILDAVKAYATLGEISDAMRDVFGEHKEHVVL